jgi:VCBS repeat-containing protein
VDGGRFAATGRFDGRVDMTVTGGETILATGGGTFGLGQGSSLVFADADIDVGFDGPSGTGTFVMDGDATLGFVAEKNRIAGITEFRSGHWGLDAPGLQSVVDLGAGGTTLALDLAEKGPKTLRADLIDVDRLIGAPGAIDVSGITSSTRVTVTVDYARDAVALVAGTSGSGPKMRLHFQGSDDADVFHLGDLDAFFATVSGFRTDDIVDVTGLLRATGEDAGAIGFRSLDDGETELVLDGEAVARISHDPGLGAFGVEEAGGRTTVTVGSGSGSGSSGGNGNGGDSDDGSDSSDGGNGDGSDGGNGDGSGNDGNDSGDNAGGDGGGSDNGDGGDVSPDPGPENRAPVAGPESFAGSEDSRISGSLTAQDADGDALSYAAAVGPTHGTLTVESDGSFTYDPDADFSGADSFVYQVSDGRLSDTATVNLEVTEVNDAPTGGNDDVTARADGRTVTGNLLVNDTDPDGDDLSVAGIDTGGTRGEVVHNGDGTFTYDPGDAFARLGSSQTATDSFRYRLEDTRGGTDMVTVTVTVQGTVPAPNMIRGTDGRDEIAGTDKNDVIRSLGGNFDRMSGGEKADAFVFGKETRDGTQERDFILDYEVGRDFLALEDGARIASISDTATGAVVYFEGDNDAVYLVGDGLNAGSLSVLVVDDFSPYDWFVG